MNPQQSFLHSEHGLLRVSSRATGAYYNSYIYRWLSADTIIPDPSDSQSYNRFSYTRNNPTNRVDPSGHSDCIQTCLTEGDGGAFHWQLPDDNQIIELAETFNIPPELLAAVLHTIQAIDYDSSDQIEDSAMLLVTISSNPGLTDSSLISRAGGTLAELSENGLFGNYPSPGLAQMQLRRARETVDWVLESASGDPAYEAMAEAMGAYSADAYDESWELLTGLMNTDTAAAFVAGHLRLLMEAEYGLTVSPDSLTTADMSLISAQYNIGLGSGPAAGLSYSDYDYYKFTSFVLPYWQQRLGG